MLTESVDLRLGTFSNNDDDDDDNNNVKKQLVYEKNNCSAGASRFLVHSFDVHCTTTTNFPMRRFMEDVDILRQIFPSLFEHWTNPLKIQLQEKSATFNESSGSK